MQAIIYSEFGGSDVLEAAEVADPTPGPGEVLLRITAAGVNPLDWKIREGWMQAVMPYEFPIIPGVDAAGTVAAVGEGAARFQPGERVFCYAKGAVVHAGTYAELMAVPEHMLANVPDDVDLSIAASVPVATLTAWQALHGFIELQAGQTLLVTAGAGGVGSFAVQLARHAGATVIATASAANHDYLRELGVEHCIDYRTESVPEAVRRIAPSGCDAVLDCAGGDAYDDGVAAMVPGGRIATIVVPPDLEAAEQGGYSAAFIRSEPNGAQLANIAALLADGTLRLPAVERRSIRDAAKAQDDSQAGHTRGKIVLEIDFPA